MYLRNKKKQVIFAAVVWLILVLSFFSNFFGVGPNAGWFTNFQEDSSLITQKTARCKGELKYDGPVIAVNYNKYMQVMDSSNCSVKDLKPYDSQFGLQARVIAFFAPTNDNQLDRYFKAWKFILAGVTAALLTLVALWVRTRFGARSACTLVVFVAFSTWIVGYAQNMYWIEPLMLAPFILGLTTYLWFKKKGLLLVFYCLEILLVFLKLLDGYEHISTLVISILVPIVFFEILSKRKVVSLWRETILVAALGLVAFTCALGVHTASLANYYGSWSKASQHIQARETARSVSGLRATQPDVVINFQATLPKTYDFVDQFIDLNSMKGGNSALYKYALVSAINYSMLPAVSLPVTVNGVFGDFIQSILMLAMVGLLCISRVRKIPRFKKYYHAFRASYLVSLVGSISWLILMPAHAYPHAHLNAIIFYMPFLIICYIAMGVVVQDYVERKYIHQVKK